MGRAWTCSIERTSTGRTSGSRVCVNPTAPYAGGNEGGRAIASVTHFDVAAYADELAAAPTNFEIATRLVFENERIRVWEMQLEPGERMPFHCHRTPYFWICHAGGRGIQRFPDGSLLQVEFAPGDVDFLDEERLETERIHDFENAGDTTARFTAFELLD